ncbi:hypothetical protein ACQCSX_19230 [Pseudarthrobacter sp. P1]|uniref:hypothetical protein n=1 Tax=Pseudarthrobacter sp. P1 TaxID=3418418 RepID=UPI003CEED601
MAKQRSARLRAPSPASAQAAVVSRALAPRITVEMPVLGIGSGPADYEGLGRFVRALRRPVGLHLTLLHIGVLADFARDVEVWTRGTTSAARASEATVAWLRGLPVLEPFSGSAGRLVVLGGGGVYGLEVAVPGPVRDFQVSLVEGLHGLLDGLLVDNVDDFILGSRALGYRYPRWTPHVAVGRPGAYPATAVEVAPLRMEFGPSQIRNARFLPGSGDG